MQGVLRIALVLALSVGATSAVQAQGPAAQPQPALALLGNALGVSAEADLSEAVPLAAEDKPFKPSYLDKPCSFMPSKNPIKVKKNACRFV